MTRIIYSRQFVKHFARAPLQIQEAFEKRLLLFIDDRRHTLLHVHALQGQMSGFWSINVSGDWRAIYHEGVEGAVEWVEFIDIGTHSQLYR